jgi:NAD+ diphosphatase
MLHDIDGTFDNQYRARTPQPGDWVLSFCAESHDALLMRREGDSVILPTVAEAGLDARELCYLFDLDGAGFFLAREPVAEKAPAANAGGIDFGQVDPADPGAAFAFRYEPLGMFRWICPRETRLAVEVGWQLAGWYRDNRFCGRCGAEMAPDRVERILSCISCGMPVYPRINPGVIVGVTDGDDLLLTRYAGRGFTNWALVAGFTEIGESLEQTVAREVMEETGVRVKNIRYFGNQPWPRSSSLLVGFFAELDGPRDIRIDEAELAHAEWVNWRDVPHEPDGYSLTRTMMCAFHAARQAGRRI